MFIAKAPHRSYWEGAWKFPKTGSSVSISLRGDEHGPTPESRHFYLGLPERLDQILDAARPKLQQVFVEWLHRELPDDIFDALNLAGFDVEDPNGEPLRWDIRFETKGEKWLGITVPFVADEAQDAVVDT